MLFNFTIKYCNYNCKIEKLYKGLLISWFDYLLIARKLQDIEYSSLLQIKAETVIFKFGMFSMKNGGVRPPTPP